MKSLNDYVRNLIGKEVTLSFAGGDFIYGELIDVLAEVALVLRLEDGEIAICSTVNLNMIREGGWEEDDDDLCAY